MKKLLLASIVMFGICSFVNAQTPESDMAAKKAAGKKNTNTTTATPALANAPAATPQKAAVATTTTSTIAPDGTVVEAKVASKESKTPEEKAKSQADAQQAQRLATKKNN